VGLFYHPVLPHDVPIFFSVTHEYFGAGREIPHGEDEDPYAFDVICAVIPDSFGSDGPLGIIRITRQRIFGIPCIDDMVAVDIIDVPVRAVPVVHLLPFKDLALIFYDLLSFGDGLRREQALACTRYRGFFNHQLFFQ
jgi:hypothetical protein